MNRAEEMNEKR